MRIGDISVSTVEAIPRKRARSQSKWAEVLSQLDNGDTFRLDLGPDGPKANPIAAAIRNGRVAGVDAGLWDAYGTTEDDHQILYVRYVGV